MLGSLLENCNSLTDDAAVCNHNINSLALNIFILAGSVYFGVL
jgi:hypothetical protein